VVSLERNNPGLDDGTPLAFTACASRRAIPQRSFGAISTSLRHNPNGIESTSPGLPVAGYPGNRPATRINPERVVSPGDQCSVTAILRDRREEVRGNATLIPSALAVSVWPFSLLVSAQASKEALLAIEAKHPSCEVDRLTTAAANDSFLNGKGS